MSKCTEPNCQRPAGHKGLHFSRKTVNFGPSDDRIVEDEWGDLPQEDCPHCNECTHLEQLAAQLQRAVEGLRRYGVHWGNEAESEPNRGPSCARWVSAPCADSGIDLYNSQPCTCGLDALLADLEGSGAK